MNLIYSAAVNWNNILLFVYNKNMVLQCLPADIVDIWKASKWDKVELKVNRGTKRYSCMGNQGRAPKWNFTKTQLDYVLSREILKIYIWSITFLSQHLQFCIFLFLFLTVPITYEYYAYLTKLNKTMLQFRIFL